MCATKRLAREIGAIHKGASLLGISANKRQKFKQGLAEQFFSHFIVLDFEATCWESRKTDRDSEIIEFPAVLLNTRSGEVEAEFQTFVKPTENYKLSPFCKQLTGISQEQVDAGVPLETCLSLFDHWIRDLVTSKEFVLASSAAGPWRNLYTNLCTFLTWSDWDLGRCLPNECRRKQLHYPPYLKQWIDIRAAYKTFYQRKPRGVVGSLEDLGMTFEGKEHSGIDDARNTAFLAYRMIQDGCELRVTKSLFQRAERPWHHRKPSLADRALRHNKNASQTADAPCSKEDYSHREVTPLNTKSGDVALTSAPCIVKESLLPACRHLDQSEAPESIFDDSLSDKDLLQALFHQPASSGEKASVCLKPSVPIRDFDPGVLCPIDVTLDCDALISLEGSRSKGNSTAVISKGDTGDPESKVNDEEHLSDLVTVTPPFCRCGRRAKLRVVRKKGRNYGRRFFSCKSQAKSCNFFQWLSVGDSRSKDHPVA